MKYDYKTLYEKNAAFYNARPKAKQALLVFNLLFTLVFFLAYGALAVDSLISPDRFGVTDTVKILGIPALCVFLVTVLRLAVNRPRPYSEAGAKIEPLLKKHGAQDKSFPSRHISCAFVIAFVFLPYKVFGAAIWVGATLLVLACVLAYIRFALGLHYPSDLVGGAALAFFCSLLLLI
ncbi:MAG: phosphatase PAP2 family protein [Clostridia bacterium]|nr:phosphatase PAP2 family protein [Clostridia bacterium]